MERTETPERWEASERSGASGRPGTSERSVASERWEQFVSTIGPLRVLRALGGLLLLLAAGRWTSVGAVTVPTSERLVDSVLIGGPGLVLLYVGHWLPKSRLRPDVYSRVATWCLAGLATMLVVVGLMLFNPGGSAEEPYWAMAVAGSLGALAGVAIGVYNATALSRAREAEQHRDLFRTERDLRERVFDTSPVGIVVVNADGSIRNVNEYAAEVLGLPKAELLELAHDESPLGATVAEAEPVDEDGRPPGAGEDPPDGGADAPDPDAADSEACAFRRVSRTGEAVHDVERRITRPDGRRIWLSANGAPLRDASEAVTAVVVAFEEVTERRQLEAELRETVGQVERSNDRLRQFAYAASHDMQEPLRMVSSYLQLLENKHGEDLDAEAREYLDFAVDGADRMREMIDDLLAYSRLDRDDPEFERVDCEELVERVLLDLQVQIEERNAAIDVESLPTVVADENRLEQVFQNLVSNAIKYSGDDPPRVEIGAERGDDRITFRVADEGIGIDAAHEDRIFEVFERLHGEEYDGTGVGLSLCEKVVSRHGGRIWVESDPGEGATFYFTLPRQAPEQRREASP